MARITPEQQQLAQLGFEELEWDIDTLNLRKADMKDGNGSTIVNWEKTTVVKMPQLLIFDICLAGSLIDAVIIFIKYGERCYLESFKDF